MAVLAEGAPLTIRAQFPRKFRFLLEEKARYKVAYGGRGGAKSWQFARALLIRGLKGNLRVLCTREVLSSLKASSKQLLADQIKLLGLEAFYTVLEAEIRGPAGTLFMFKGMGDPDGLKSAEGVDVAWIEEANVVTETTWKKFYPTVRKPGAEIWISFNPELPSDYLYKLFIKGPRPPNSIVVKVSYRDNPFFNREMLAEIEQLKAEDYDEYLWVWEGACRVALEGAVYAKQLREMQKGERSTKVKVDPARPVHLFLDLGKGDMTAIWFVQIVQGQYHVVNYFQANGLEVDDYAEKLRTWEAENGAKFGTMWLPHDAEHQRLGMRRTIRQQFSDAGFKTKMVPNIRVADGVAAARAIFKDCWFDEEHCSDGIDCLRQYHYEVDEDGTRSKLPVHDWSSHGADGFRYMGVALRDEPAPVVRKKPKLLPKASGRHSWLGR